MVNTIKKSEKDDSQLLSEMEMLNLYLSKLRSHIPQRGVGNKGEVGSLVLKGKVVFTAVSGSFTYAAIATLAQMGGIVEVRLCLRSGNGYFIFFPVFTGIAHNVFGFGKGSVEIKSGGGHFGYRSGDGVVDFVVSILL